MKHHQHESSQFFQQVKGDGKVGKLNGKMALITGGGSGIGRAAALLFSDELVLERKVVSEPCQGVKHSCVDEKLPISHIFSCLFASVLKGDVLLSN